MIAVSEQSQADLSVPNKDIPTSIALIGTFQIGVALFYLIILFLIGTANLPSLMLLAFALFYGGLGAGLWAIEEWARRINIIIHIGAIPFTIFTLPYYSGELNWQPIAQVVISLTIVYFLTRPEMRHKFQTVVPKQKSEESHTGEPH